MIKRSANHMLITRKKVTKQTRVSKKLMSSNNGECNKRLTMKKRSKKIKKKYNNKKRSKNKKLKSKKKNDRKHKK